MKHLVIIPISQGGKRGCEQEVKWEKKGGRSRIGRGREGGGGGDRERVEGVKRKEEHGNRRGTRRTARG